MDRNFPEKLIKLRKKKRETQLDVAKAINVSQSTYAMYERGQRVPSDENKKKIASHFEKTVQNIFFE